MDLHLARNIEEFILLSGRGSWSRGEWLPTSYEGIALQLDVLSEESQKESLLMVCAVKVPRRRLPVLLKTALSDYIPSKFCGLPVRFVAIGDKLACSVVMPRESGAREWFVVYSVLVKRLRCYSMGGEAQ
ncbi:hypothetical protein [Burkholderia sp. Bp8986]|uniref:hypothetical protein n=1 Tax=Burkholderia sp. Bp8986 TaxID=2184550 RepID=UPI000F59D86F|nr:hypothetical protein [Burkholderia sp. Bp8986]